MPLPLNTWHVWAHVPTCVGPPHTRTWAYTQKSPTKNNKSKVSDSIAFILMMFILRKMTMISVNFVILY